MATPEMSTPTDFPTGSGVLSFVNLKRKGKIETQNPEHFYVGQKVDIFSALMRKYKGTITLTAVQVKTRTLEAECIPAGVRKGDFLVLRT